MRDRTKRSPRAFPKTTRCKKKVHNGADSEKRGRVKSSNTPTLSKGGPLTMGGSTLTVG